MDKIRALKDKYNMPNDDELFHAFHTDFPRMEETLREQEEQLLGMNIKLQELKSKVEISDESLCTERHVLNTKMEELTACNERLKELEIDRNTLMQEIHDLDSQRMKMKNKKPNQKDQQTIEHGKKKFEYYKLLTGIRWDFAAPKGTSKGYITNGKEYIHSFNYKIHDNDGKLEDLLWNEIGRAMGQLEMDETDENQPPNN